MEVNQIILGNCLEIMSQWSDDTVDLILTSPPYADARKNTYGGVHPNNYVEWFLPISLELKRILKPTGSFVLNIKEKVVNGQRHPYVINLILEMKKQGWLWTDEYIWCKKNSFPGKWNNRFRDAWERCLHFTKERKFKMCQESVMVPVGDWVKSRFYKTDKETGLLVKKDMEELCQYDKKRSNSVLQSGMNRKTANWLNRDMAYPTNVLHLATECSNKGHPAVFPIELPKWFIPLFTEENDLVLDPFLGSGTTAMAAKVLGRDYLGIEINPDYIDLANKRVQYTKEYQCR